MLKFLIRLIAYPVAASTIILAFLYPFIKAGKLLEGLPLYANYEWIILVVLSFVFVLGDLLGDFSDHS